MYDYYNKDTGMFSVRLVEDNGFCSRSYNVDIPEETYVEVTRINEYGYTFLKYNGEVWIKHPINGCYDIVKSQKQIDIAFNPEKYEIEQWLSE